MATYDLALLPVKSGDQVYEWLGAPEEERRGWDLASAINLARMPGNLDRRTREWYENVLAVYMIGFPNDPDFWHAVCHKQYEFSIDRVLFPCFPDWVKDDHVLWLELLCRSSQNTHLVAHTGPTLRTSGPFFEALLERRPEAITYLPREALELHSELVDAVISDWTRAGQALRCLYSGPNYDNLLKRILAVHGRDTRAVAAFASVSWLAFDNRLVVHSEPCVQLVEPEIIAATDHHELQSLTTRVTDLEAQVEALTRELGHSRDHIRDQENTIGHLHGRLRDRSRNYQGGPWNNNNNNKRRRDYN